MALDKMGACVLATCLTKEGEQSLKSATDVTDGCDKLSADQRCMQRSEKGNFFRYVATSTLSRYPDCFHSSQK